MGIWVILAAMTGAAVFLLLWPLSRRPEGALAGPEGLAAHAVTAETGFYRDQLSEIARDEARGLLVGPEVEAARGEAARRLLRASRAPAPRAGAEGEPALRRRRAASAFALSTVPLVALLVYGLYGSPDLPAEPAAARAASASAPSGAARDFAAAIGEIEAHLAAHPEDGRGWAVLAPVYLRVGRVDDAVRAYETALQVLGDDPERLVDYGTALLAAGNGVVTPKARAALERAVALDPSAPRPRFLLAQAAAQEGRRDEARSAYEALIAQAPTDAPWLPIVRESLARLDGGSAPAMPPAGPESEAGRQVAALPPESRQAAIRGMVEGLSSRLSAQGGSPEEWGRLVRAYAVLGDAAKADEALGRARSALAGDAAGLARVEAVARELKLRTALAEGPQ